MLILDGVSEINDDVENGLAQAGCTDAIVGVRNGVVFLDFDRQAPSAELAVLTAIRDVESAGLGASVVQVEPDDIVSQAEISRRTGRTRETVRLWVEGERGPGSFPRPRSGITSRSLVWRWVEVARWLNTTELQVSSQTLAIAETIATINGALDLRQHRAGYTAELNKLSEMTSSRI
ncbi:MAG: hypothetical protein H7Z43_11825 [Clostridia bacterium]|nr:hypothetical protein [Deltaproteobacteria bacterium]